ncbi:MAG TPA: hypothetical protein PKD21_11775 [Candidatus Competibacter phosphatis]|nr:hypothetical protein [Candidatus Competibacter phosphatis]
MTHGFSRVVIGEVIANLAGGGQGFSRQRREAASRDGALQKVGGIDDRSETEQHEGPVLLKVNARSEWLSPSRQQYPEA